MVFQTVKDTGLTHFLYIFSFNLFYLQRYDDELLVELQGGFELMFPKKETVESFASYVMASELYFGPKCRIFLELKIVLHRETTSTVS